MSRLAALLLTAALALPAAAQVDPVQWDACIAAPAPDCVIALTMAALAAEPPGEADYEYRRLSEMYLAHGQPEQATAMVRLILDPGTALYLLPDIIRAWPDPAAVDLAMGHVLAQDSPEAIAIDQFKIVRALIDAGDLVAAAIIATTVPAGNQRDYSGEQLVAAYAQVGDAAGVEAMLAIIDDPARRDRAAADSAAELASPGPPSPAEREVALQQLEQALTAPRGTPEYGDYEGDEFAAALAAEPADIAIAGALRIADSDVPAEYAAMAQIAVLAATGDPAVEIAAVNTIDRIQHRFQRASARIDLAPHLTDPAHLARMLDWAAVPTGDLDRAFMLAELAAATGLPDLAEKAVYALPAITDNVDRRDHFESILPAVAAGPDPARVATLLALWGDDERPTADAALALSVAAMARGGQAALAADLARDMTYDERMATSLGRIAAVTGDQALMAETLTMARDVVSDIYRAGVLIDIATAMLDAG